MKSLVVALLLALAGICHAQAPLTNDDVIDLVKSGLGFSVIAAKVEESPTKFDTSVAELKRLADARVPDSIVALMIRKQGAVKASLSDVPETGGLADLKGKKTFYLAVSDEKSRERITKELSKAGFRPIDKIEDADFGLRYEQWEEPVPNTQYTKKIGILHAFIVANITGEPRRRDIYTVRKEKYLITTSEPASATAAQLVKELKNAK